MKTLAIIGGALLGVMSLFGIVWTIGLKRAAEAVTGRPTPEDARVKVDAAMDKAAKETAERVGEVKHASPDDDAKWARDAIRDGLRDK